MVAGDMRLQLNYMDSVENPPSSSSVDSRFILGRACDDLADALAMDGPDVAAIMGLASVALIAGAITIYLTIDVQGDGPTRANWAYLWSRHPAIETYGYWLPGFTYFAGLCVMVIHHALLAPRLYNLGLGTITIAAFYSLVRKLYGSPAALLSTAALAVLPLRIGLSDSSLTETSFLFFVIAALLCTTIATEDEVVRVIALVLSLIFFGLAEMTRYEIWPLIPLVVCYLYACSRRISLCAVAAASSR